MFSCLAAAFTVATAGALADNDDNQRGVHTATPIKHLVVIFQENISFDHYFGTYPHAQNNPGEQPSMPRRIRRPASTAC
jgi:phospholipase C